MPPLQSSPETRLSVLCTSCKLSIPTILPHIGSCTRLEYLTKLRESFPCQWCALYYYQSSIKDPGEEPEGEKRGSTVGSNRLYHRVLGPMELKFSALLACEWIPSPEPIKFHLELYAVLSPAILGGAAYPQLSKFYLCDLSCGLLDPSLPCGPP